MRITLNEKENINYRPLPVMPCSGICDGTERTWSEYIPSSYTGEEAVPVVLVLHGGASGGQIVLHAAEKQAAWTHVAEDYGFIAVFPHSLSDTISWNVWEIYTGDDGYKDDVAYLDWLTDTVCTKYNINRNRIYLYGHSFGAVMGTEYALKRSGRLAAACLCSGPENASAYTRPDGSICFGEDSALPVLLYHGSEDLSTPSGKWPHVSEGKLTACNPGKALIEAAGGITDEARKLKMELSLVPNMLLWSCVNGSDCSPAFTVKDRLNIVKYSGKQPLYCVFEEMGGHFLPIYAAEYIWKFFFSSFANCGGTRIKLVSWERLDQDYNAFVFACGARIMLLDNQAEIMAHPVACAEEDLISLCDAERYFPAALGILKSCGKTIRINNTEYVSLGMCAKVSGLKCAQRDGITYISDHDGNLSYDMCYIIRVCLGLEKRMTVKDCRELERKELAVFGQVLPVYHGRG